MALYYFCNQPHARGRDGSKIDTKAHYDYISREGNYAHIKGKEEDLVFVCSGNIPNWANNAGVFWETAEENRQVNGRAYREIRLGLQEELSLEDNVELIEEFLEKSGIGKNHAFTYTIHDKKAAYDKDHRNIHCHLMFCEKSIEKDRPLGPDMYFKHYYLDRNGNPCAGYKADRYYHDRKGNLEMRKMWADIVNAKFRERGIDKQISEKTLAAQREELLAQGKTEEAEYLDRIPAPHLGEAYKNPKVIEHIRQRVEEFDRQTDYPFCSADEAYATDHQDSIAEQKIICFAADKVLRRVMKEIEQERLRLRREEIMRIEAERAEIEDEEEAERLANEPVVVTAEDVYTELAKRADKSVQEQTQKLAKYRELKKKIIPEKLLRNLAIERVVGKEYHNLQKHYKRVLAELVPMEKKYHELKQVPYEQKKDFDHAYANKLREKQALQKQIRVYNQEIEDREEEIQSVIDEMTKKNQSLTKQTKKLYAEAMKAKGQAKRYNQKAVELKENVPDKEQILYSRQLPRLVMRKSKLHGQKPLKDFPIIAFRGRAYVIIEDNQQKQDFTADAQHKKALLLGDTVKKGRASIYTVEFDKDNAQPTSVEKTKESVCLYGNQRPSKQSSSLKQTSNHCYPKAQSIQHQQRLEIVNKIDHFIGKAFDDSQGKYTAWLDDEDHSQKKDKVRQAEKDMYRGWSM